MNAAEFYQHFEDSFNRQKLPAGLKRVGGNTPKWSVAIESGTLQFALTASFKSAGLVDRLLWPGEHRMETSWITGRGKERKHRFVSLFQYTTETEVVAFTEILRNALRKYLAAHGPDPYGTLREYLTSDLATPKPNVDTFYYHFDADDARQWGEWYGSMLAPWILRFVERPESNDDWARRAL